MSLKILCINKIKYFLDHDQIYYNECLTLPYQLRKNLIPTVSLDQKTNEIIIIKNEKENRHKIGQGLGIIKTRLLLRVYNKYIPKNDLQMMNKYIIKLSKKKRDYSWTNLINYCKTKITNKN